MVDEVALGRSCDSVLNSYIIALDLSKRTIKTSDSLLTEVRLSRDTYRFTSEKKDSLLINQNSQHKIDLKIATKKGVKKGLGLGIAIVILYEATKIFIR